MYEYHFGKLFLRNAGVAAYVQNIGILITADPERFVHFRTVKVGAPPDLPQMFHECGHIFPPDKKLCARNRCDRNYIV